MAAYPPRLARPWCLAADEAAAVGTRHIEPQQLLLGLCAPWMLTTNDLAEAWPDAPGTREPV
jgi:hypothetical protein